VIKTVLLRRHWLTEKNRLTVKMEKIQSSYHRSKATLKRWVFRDFLKASELLLFPRLSGKAFHSFFPAIENALSPYLLWTNGSYSLACAVERRFREGWYSSRSVER